jgi:putative OPT family oligopeptide transporter
VTIIIGSVVTGIAAIANDNTQDLKVGQLVGATPWRQQVMLLLGVVVSALVIPPVMQLLFDVYGIDGVLPHPGMDLSKTLPAPTAALMAAITEAVFQNALPWNMMFFGAAIILALIVINYLCRIGRYFRLSILGVAIGMYLPLASSVPLFLGGLIAFLVGLKVDRKDMPKEEKPLHKQRGVLIACGLVAGSALVDVLLAIPFSIFHSPDALMLVGPGWYPYSIVLAVISILALGLWIGHRVSGSSLERKAKGRV